VLTAAEKLTPEQVQILAASDRATAELLAADTVVIAAGFINFSIPSTLKSWIDHVTRSQKTFRYGPQGPEGLATGKKVYVVIASTGTYTSGPAVGMDHARPYLKSMLGFLGMTDVEFVNAEGVGLGVETDEQIIARALANASRQLPVAA
jgi:FMN-dependent NADH-azoreductase